MTDHEITLEDELEYIGEQLRGIREALEKLVETTSKPDSKDFYTETI